MGRRVTRRPTARPGGTQGLTTGPTGVEDRALRPPTKRQLDAVYRVLLDRYGHQQWWPTAVEDPEAQRFEICAGAILVQNTSWRGADAALRNLRDAGVLNPHAILDLSPDVLGDLLRPSGYFNLKAQRLRAFCEAIVEDGDGSIDALLDGTADEVRARLLGVWGIGAETADAMTLYAGRKPTFVVDAYAYRIFERLGRTPGPRRYDVYRSFLLRYIGPDVTLLNEWHALLVRHGQQTCVKTRPLCEECPLLDRCAYGRRARSEVR